MSSAFINKESAHNDNDFGICTSNGEISGLARHQKDSIIQCNAHDFVLGYQQHARVSIQIAFSPKRFSAWNDYRYHVRTPRKVCRMLQAHCRLQRVVYAPAEESST